MEMNFKSSYLKKLRTEKLWSQEELATASDLSLRTIQRVEREGTGSVETLKALASALEVNTADLILRESPLAYKHTQIAWTILLAISIFYFTFAAIAFLSLTLYLITGVILLLVCIAFSTLSISVDEHELKWSFGPKIIRKQELISEIAACKIVKNKWWWGFGIRFIPNGQWLYNVSGADGVEVILKSGKKFRLGTDEPNYLNQAINDAIKAS